ncbi:major capsid protein [Fadolivirus algeromassiliense]|uniref:Major capsid protein n=1 Tax=Fadolivirus FV1/VV64 TaxID=3070911 RepID=A0A7D3UVC3_9VIRU|nr:major capsid protein [Fadolivirus algeromassiliense]QKF93934.1 major capsid protein [Fadolivirus FV1/VV64]
MAGGLIQLVAYGNQDIFITHDPQITFFKVVYRRHTNFTLEVIPQNFLQNADFGKRVTSVLSRNGDLIRKIHLVIDLPSIPTFKDESQNVDQIAKFAWVKRIGYAIIKTVEIEIGGELIDRQYGDWLNIWHELTFRDQKDISKILGDVKELTDFTNGKPTYRLFIPLQFWFNRVAGLALPVVSLQYNHIKINLELNDFERCYVLTPTHSINIDNDFVNFEQFEYITQNVDGIVSTARFVYYDYLNRVMYLSRVSDNGFLSVTETDSTKIQTEQQQKELLYETDLDGNLVNGQYYIIGAKSKFQAMPRINSVERIYKNRSVNFKNIVLKNCFLLVEYGFLDDEERIRFSKARHEYLIEQIFFNGEETVDGLHQSFKVGFTQACKELVWVTQLSSSQNTRNNDTFNYTDSLLKDDNGKYIGKNIIVKETLMFNGHERISMRESEYFSKIQPYQHHTHNPPNGINIYSFSIHPENHQPSGTANMSRIDNIDLRIAVVSDINFNNTAKLRIYGIVYNILRIANGISGLVFSIDY